MFKKINKLIQNKIETLIFIYTVLNIYIMHIDYNI